MCGEGAGEIDDTYISLDILLQNDQNSALVNLFTVILISRQP